MGRSGSYCDEKGQKKGVWTASEDQIVKDYVKKHGVGKWGKLSRETGLKRCGKSVRLRWMNYLRPDIRRGNIAEDEEELIIRLHKLLGNRWSLIAGRLPGRTDNEIKNYWHSVIKKKLLPQENHSNACKNETKDNLSSSPAAANTADAATVEDDPQLTKNNVNEDEDHHQHHHVEIGVGFEATNKNGGDDNDYLRRDMGWNSFKMNLNESKLDLSEFQTDLSMFSEFAESTMMNIVDIGDCNVHHSS